MEPLGLEGQAASVNLMEAEMPKMGITKSILEAAAAHEQSVNQPGALWEPQRLVSGSE